CWHTKSRSGGWVSYVTGSVRFAISICRDRYARGGGKIGGAVRCVDLAITQGGKKFLPAEMLPPPAIVYETGSFADEHDSVVVQDLGCDLANPAEDRVTIRVGTGHATFAIVLDDDSAGE